MIWWTEILVQPVQRFADDNGLRHKVSRRLNNVLFVGCRCSKELEERFGRCLKPEARIEPAVKLEHRAVDSRQVMSHVNLRTNAKNYARLVEYPYAQAGLDSKYNASKSSAPTESVVGESPSIDVRSRFEIVNRAAKILNLLNYEISTSDR